MEPTEFDQEVRLEFYRSGVHAIREVGILALKTLIGLNSGAFVVLLTFIGNTAAQSKFVVPLENLKLAMFLFLGGITFSFIVIAYTYVASHAASPYPTPNKRSDGWYVPLAVLLTAIGFICFVSGVVSVISGVSSP
ncbi:hypothetical protein MCELHM10_02059 [Paracoccaceae bacterium]